MDFEITLTAKTTDEGGLTASFDRQLAELGGEATLVEEVEPYRVDGSTSNWFESRRKYRIVS